MNTNNRLQFRFHDQVFDTREAAIEYIQSQIRFTEEGLAAEDPSYGFSLLAEPTVLLYKKEEDETDPHLIFVIGSQTNEGTQYSDNRFCIIDIDKTEQEIADLAEELEKAIKSLTLIALSSDTLNFYAEKTDEGTYVSGDVKVAETHIFDNVSKKNNLMVTPEGLFIYVNLEYDPENEQFTFTVSNADGTLTETTVDFSDNYLVGGYYDKTDESIHLQMKDGEEVIVDCEDLIAEWGVEGEASRTPVVLRREEVDYDHTDEHHHVEPWQDVLRADVRIKDEEFDDQGRPLPLDKIKSTNILQRTRDGKYLYVDGKASNIIYYKNGQLSNVKEALDALGNVKLSTDSDNIIMERTDGFFASSTLEYISKDNKLIFKTSGQNGDKRTEILLNSVELFEHIYYDPTKESLIVTYKDSKGETQFVEIPIGEMIRDWEWEVQNEGHNVKIVKKRNISGNDKVSADVKIYDDPDNILVDKNHELLVKGTADNIKYENGTVKDALDDLKATDAALDNNINIEIARAEAAEETLDSKIGEGFDPRNTVRDEIDNLQSEIEAVSADSASSIKDVINIDESINVDKTDPTKPVISVNLSDEVEDNKPNIIKLNADGLYAGVDLLYQFNEEVGTNQLIFKTTNATKVYDLKTNSVIDKIYYDPSREAIIIEYTVNGHRMPDVVIPIGDLINEWRVEDGHPHAVELEKVRIASGTSEQDVLKASVIITDDHDDNILVMDDGALYVPGGQIEQNAQDIADLKDRMNTAEGDIDNLEAALALETERRISGDTQLQEKISTEEARAREAETRIESSLNSEISRAQVKEGELNSAITAETLRAQEADNQLQEKISNETAARAAKDAELESLINQESARAQVIETTISERLTSEISRSTAEDASLAESIANEAEIRATADNDLEEQIRAAKLTFSPSKVDFSYNGTIEFNDYTTDDNIVKANVILQGGDNIIKVGSGLYATATLEYEPTGNKIRLVTSNGAQEYIQLVGATLLDSIEYDQINKMLIIKYTDGTGSQRETAVGVTDLWNEWIVQNPSDKSAVEMTKTIGDPGNPDTLSARVLITDDRDGDGKPDEGSNNLVEIRNNGLYVDGSKISGATEEVACVKNELKTIEAAIFGNPVGQECGSGFTYTPYQGACVISGATSLYEADQMLNDQICQILSMWTSGKTCSSESQWVEDGTNRKIEVDVRLSRGKLAEMTDDDVIIENLSGDYVDPTGTEFTDTNVLRIVCLSEGPSGITPSIDSMQNGVYLSNVWDCGLYYGNTAEDAEAKAKAQAAGYNTNYSTDEDSSASNYNYMNNVR